MRPRLYYGWVVVAASAVGLAFSGPPIAVYSFGVFLPAFVEEFHQGRGAISLAFTIHNMVGAVVASLVGLLSDRFGARRVVVLGLVLLGITATSAFAIRGGLIQLYVFYALLGVATLVTSQIGYSLLISRWFDRHRGLALGLMMASLGVSAILVPPVIHVLIMSFGWRAAFAIYGVGVLLVPLPIVVVLLREPPSPAPTETAPMGQARSPADHTGVAWGDIWRDRTFWVMATSFFAVGATVHACALHMPELLSDLGARGSVAALASSITGLAILVGRVSSGYLLDRAFGPRVAISFFALATIGLVMLITSREPAVAFVAAFLVGLSFGAEVDVMAFLLGRYFGLRAFGIAFGAAFSAFVLAGGLGPFLMGVGFDYTGSYREPLLGFVVVMLSAIFLMTRLGAYRYGISTTNGDDPRARSRRAGSVTDGRSITKTQFSFLSCPVRRRVVSDHAIGAQNTVTGTKGNRWLCRAGLAFGQAVSPNANEFAAGEQGQ